MIIMVLGSDGQLGTAIKKNAFFDKCNDWHFLNRSQADIRNKDSIIGIAQQIQPNIIINCAALTNVDKLENNPEDAFAVNAFGAANVAEAAIISSSKLIHISTDYVFGGKGIIENDQIRPYNETDETNPLSIYGKSKLQGEKLIQSGKSNYLIIRTSWLYGGRNDFVSKIVKQAYSGETLQVVNDQIGSPTSADELARAIDKLMVTDYFGLLHGTCSGQVSRYDFANCILRQYHFKNQIKPISSNILSNAAKRPEFSVLDNTRLNNLGFYKFCSWETALNDFFSKHTIQMILKDQDLS